jgi:hypothetical protein
MKKGIAFLFVACVSAAIFMFIKNPDVGFNMIAYAFYLLLRPNNASSGGETPFIMGFDFLFSIGVALCLYWFIDHLFFDDKKI